MEEFSGVSLLNSYNKSFLKDRSIKLTNEAEILQNINIKLGLPAPLSGPARRQALMFLSTLSFILFILSAAMLRYAFPKIVDLLSGIYIIDHDKNIVIIVFGLGILSSVLFLGYLFAGYRLSKKDSNKANLLYKDLVEHGKILSAQVVEVTRIAGIGTEVKYRFEVEKNSIVNSKYIIASYEKTIKTGDKIYVLYLNKKINILI